MLGGKGVADIEWIAFDFLSGSGVNARWEFKVHCNWRWPGSSFEYVVLRVNRRRGHSRRVADRKAAAAAAEAGGPGGLGRPPAPAEWPL